MNKSLGNKLVHVSSISVAPELLLLLLCCCCCCVLVVAVPLVGQTVDLGVFGQDVPKNKNKNGGEKKV